MKSIWNFKMFENIFWKKFWEIFGTEKSRKFTIFFEKSRFSEFFRKIRKSENFQCKSSYKNFGFSIFEKKSKSFHKYFSNIFEISDRLEIGFAISVVKTVPRYTDGMLSLSAQICGYRFWLQSEPLSLVCQWYFLRSRATWLLTNLWQ